MEVIFFYMLFAVTTSLSAMYELILPVIRQLEPGNTILEYKLVSYITFFLLAFLAAPILLPITLIPSLGERFKHSLLGSLNQD